MIPRRIFQTWKSKTEIPENMAHWQSTWRKHNADYVYQLWDDEDNRNFIKEYYPWFLEKYDSYDVMIKRADAIRYFYLYHYGGVYVDMDFECIRNFDDILELDADVIFGYMGNPTEYNHEHNIPNAIMISKPRANFWLCMFYNLMRTPSYNSVEYTTGPVVLKSAIEIYTQIINENMDINTLAWYIKLKELLSETLQPEHKLSHLNILPGEYFYPLNWRDWDQQQKLRHPVVPVNKNHKGIIYDEEKVKELFPNSYAVTYWTHSY